VQKKSGGSAYGTCILLLSSYIGQKSDREKNMEVLKPTRLRPGDVIGLVAPASRPSADERVEKGVQYLEHLGYRVKVGRHVYDLHGYLAGRDEDRAGDFNEMIRDKNVKAIFTVRGGYGTPRILQLLDYRTLAQNPKIIAGYSDITGLQLAIFRKIGLVTFSGPMIGVEMWNEIDPFTEESFWQQLTSGKKIGILKNPEGEPEVILRGGKAQGRLLGGNLSLTVSLMGTPFMPALRGSILVLEDVDEEPHRIDRMLAQMLNGGILGSLAGLAFGKFTECVPSDSDDPSLTLEQVQHEYMEKIHCPVVAGIQYGHVPKKFTIPLGLRAILNTKQGSLKVIESGVL
jgi:muramoyltetrapeptide carboxypeptidase